MKLEQFLDILVQHLEVAENQIRNLNSAFSAWRQRKVGPAVKT